MCETQIHMATCIALGIAQYMPQKHNIIMIIIKNHGFNAVGNI